MRPDPQTRSTVLALAGVLILLALSLVAGRIMQRAFAVPPRPTAVITWSATPAHPTRPFTTPAPAVQPTVRALATVTPRPPAPSGVPAIPPTAEPSATQPHSPPTATPTLTRPPPTLPLVTPTVVPTLTEPPPTLPPATSTAAPTLTEPPPPAPGVAHPSGARDIVIQMSEEAGLLPRLDVLALSFPEFTLFGDGTLVSHTRTAYYQTHLDEPAIQGLLTQAITDTRFFELEPFYNEPNIYDAPVVHLRVVAGGQDHTSSALALGLTAADQTAPPAAPRARLLRLVAALRALMAEGGPPYVPAAVTLYAEGGSPAAPADPAPAWPLPGVTLASVLQQGNGGSGTAVRLTGPDAAAALTAAAIPRPFLEAGRRYTVVAVPDGP